MKLIVGLGNPGQKYEGTRHNVGWEVLSHLARQCAASNAKSRFQGEVAEARVGSDKVLLLCPLTFMNLSGTSVQQARDFYKLGDQDLIVVCDDYNLPLAKLRFRAKGSSGGQRGLADIIRKLGTDEFSRLRIGIGEPPPRWNAADFVLSRFSGKDERERMDEAVSRASDALVKWVERGIEHCMNQYNG